MFANEIYIVRVVVIYLEFYIHTHTHICIYLANIFFKFYNSLGKTSG